MKISVGLNAHEGRRLTRWADDDRRVSKKKPTVTKELKEKNDVSVSPIDAEHKPRMSTKIWIALRDRNNSKHPEY